MSKPLCYFIQQKGPLDNVHQLDAVPLNHINASEHSIPTDSWRPRNLLDPFQHWNKQAKNTRGSHSHCVVPHDPVSCHPRNPVWWSRGLGRVLAAIVLGWGGERRALCLELSLLSDMWIKTSQGVPEISQTELLFLWVWIGLLEYDCVCACVWVCVFIRKFEQIVVALPWVMSSVCHRCPQPDWGMCWQFELVCLFLCVSVFIYVCVCVFVCLFILNSEWHGNTLTIQ